MTVKRCSRGDNCVHPDGPMLPATLAYFGRRTSTKDGLRSECRKCKNQLNKERAAKWRRNHPEKVREYSKQYRQRNAVQVRERARQRYKDNPAPKKEQNRRWQRKNPDRMRILRQNYRMNHPEKERQRRHLRNSRKRLLPSDFNSSDWQYALQYFHGGCAYCGNPPSLFDTNTTLHREHYIPIVLRGGYIPKNVVPACQSCNDGKGSKHPHDWLIERFGKRRAREIEARIQEYFKGVRQIPGRENAESNDLDTFDGNQVKSSTTD